MTFDTTRRSRVLLFGSSFHGDCVLVSLYNRQRKPEPEPDSSGASNVKRGDENTGEEVCRKIPDLPADLSVIPTKKQSIFYYNFSFTFPYNQMPMQCLDYSKSIVSPKS